MIYRHEVLWGLDFSRLAYEDYVDDDPSDGELVSISDELLNVNFKALSDEELDMSSSSFVSNASGDNFLYKFLTDNAYAAVSSDGNNVAIGIRGTDTSIPFEESLIPWKKAGLPAELINWADWISNIGAGVVDWGGISASFQPLVDAAINYSVSEGVSNVYFFGHSRGGAVAEWLYNNYAPQEELFGIDFKGAAFASPGVRNGTSGNAEDFISFERDADFVADLTYEDINSVTETVLLSDYGSLGLNHNLSNYEIDIFREGLVPENLNPDLSAAELILISPSSSEQINPGGEIDLEWEVANSGGELLDSTRTTLYLSRDREIDTSDQVLETYDVKYWLPSEVKKYAANLTLSETLSAGTYYLGAAVDSQGFVPETDETNNVSNLISFSIGPSPQGKADLVTSNSTATGVVTAGSDIFVDFDVENIGDEAAPQSTVAVFLSSDDAIIEPTDQLLTTYELPQGLAPGETFNGNVKVELPTGTSAGTHYVGVLADFYGEVSESNDDNNVSSGVPIEVLEPAPPGSADLRIDGFNLEGSEFDAGERINYSYDVENAGDSDAGVFTISGYVTQERSLAGADLLYDFRDPGIPANRTFVDFSGWINLGDQAETGYYYAAVELDSDNDVAESDEGNNVHYERFYLNGVNNAPQAANDTARTDEDSAVTIPVLNNDTDADGDTLTVAQLGTPAHGSLADNGDGTVTYTPDPGFDGTDSFGYTVADGKGGTDEATVSITVDPVNEAPQASDDSARTLRDTAVTLTAAELTGNDTDPDGDALVIASVGNDSNGTAVLNPDGTVTFTPDAGFAGAAGFDYTVSDGRGGEDAARVEVTVEAASPPQLTDFSLPAEIDLSDGPTSVDFSITATADSTGLSYLYINLEDRIATEAGPSYAFDVMMSGNGSRSGTFTSTRDFLVENDPGEIRVRDITLVDESGNRNVIEAGELEARGFATSFEIISGSGRDNTPPQLTDFSLPAEIDLSDGPTSVDFSITATDDSTGLSYLYINLEDRIATEAGPGYAFDVMMSGNGSRSGTFTSTRDFLVENDPGEIRVRDITLVDESGNRNVIEARELEARGFATSFEVVARDGDHDANRSPAASDVNIIIMRDTVSTLATTELTGNDADPDGDALSIASVGNASNGTVVLNPDGTVTFTPDAGFAGAAGFDYTVADGQGGEDTARVDVTVEATSPPPTEISADYRVTDERFSVSSDYEAIVDQTFGEPAFLADWNTISERYAREGGEFLSEAGIVRRDEDGVSGGAITRGGDRFWSGDRHYSFTWGEVGSNYLSHDSVDNDGVPLHLGSWYTPKYLFANTSQIEGTSNRPPVAARDEYVIGFGEKLSVDTARGLLANDRDPDGDDLSISDVAQSGLGTLGISPDGSLTFTPDPGASGRETLAYTVTDGTEIVQGDVELVIRDASEEAQIEVLGRIEVRDGQALDETKIVFTPGDPSKPPIEATTAANGTFTLMLEDGMSGYLDATRDLDAADNSSIGVSDALNVLRIAVGLDPSGGSADAFDFIAADVDRSGDVGVTDALDVLRHAVGLETDNTPEWVFIDDEADLDHINAGNVAYDTGIDLAALSEDVRSSMTGVLLGNIDDYA